MPRPLLILVLTTILAARAAEPPGRPHPDDVYQHAVEQVQEIRAQAMLALIRIRLDAVEKDDPATVKLTQERIAQLERDIDADKLKNAICDRKWQWRDENGWGVFHRNGIAETVWGTGEWFAGSAYTIYFIFGKQDHRLVFTPDRTRFTSTRISDGDLSHGWIIPPDKTPGF